MAEQSMFWPTTGTGDGVSGGYTDVRLRDVWKSTLGNGVLQYLNLLEPTGIGTSVLSVNTGAAVVAGYLYENTSSATISTSTLSSNTYGLYIIANESASALTVNRSVAGTTVAAKTTRLALNLTAPTQPYIKLGTVTTTSGVISAISQADCDWSIARGIPITNYTYILVSSVPASIPTATYTRPVLEGGSFSPFVYYDGTSSSFIVNAEGNYLVTVDAKWDTNTTNRRQIDIDGEITQLTAASFITATASTQRATAVLNLPAGSSFYVAVWQDSGATRTISEYTVKVIRL